MAKRWWFKEDAHRPRVSWTWRLLAVDDAIEHQSEEFANYGAAVSDALKHGFRPTQDHWIIESTHSMTHYEHGASSVVVSKSDQRSFLAGPRSHVREIPLGKKKRFLLEQ